jgi:adenylosuccinate lyase
MIPRYSRPAMAAIWEPRNRYRIWFEIEALVAERQGQLGQIPADAARAIREKGGHRIAAMTEADIARIEAIEAEVRHDVIAFLTWLGEGIGPEARFMHQGLTSSDVLDTTLAVQFTEALDLIDRGLARLCDALKARALEHRHTVTIGRSHGIHAEPTSFGLKLAGHWAEFARGRERLGLARREIATCAISGAVGTFAHVDPRVEAFVAARLGLAVEPVSTQVIPRDRHAMVFAVLAVIASGIERLAVEVRHLQRSEVREAEEFFHPGQKGSSAMPHKRNPVLSENLTGLARLVRGMVVPALENVALWHERDISHSSVERVIAPDATIALDFALQRLAGMIETLVVYPERMAANLEALGGVVHSGEVLLALTRAGMSREAAYAAVQRNAMATWASLGTDAARSFRDNLLADPEVTARLDAAAIDRAMDPMLHLRHVDAVLARVFGGGAQSPGDVDGG